MAPVKSEFEKSAVYTVPYVRQTTKETSTKASNIKIKLCGGVLITALLVGGILTAAYLLVSSGSRADQSLKTIEASFQVNGKDKKEEIRIDRSSEIAVFDDFTDEFTVVLDYKRNLAVFKNLKNNTCYFTNLEDIPMIENVMQQEDEGSVTRFFLVDNQEGQKDGALIVGSIMVLPGDYVAKTNNKIVSNLCAGSISFWGLVVEKPTMKNKNRDKRQWNIDIFVPFPPLPKCPPLCIFGCCSATSSECCFPVYLYPLTPAFPGFTLGNEEMTEEIIIGAIEADGIGEFPLWG